MPASIFYDGSEVNIDLTMVNKEPDIKVFEILDTLLLIKKRAVKITHRLKIHPKHAVYIIIATSKEKSTRKVILVYYRSSRIQVTTNKFYWNSTFPFL